MMTDAEVSIHAPARGATLHQKTFEPHPYCFNSRAREGRDRFARIAEARILSVSIHAPARGATRGKLSDVLEVLSFNSRAREGRDSREAFGCARSVKFQFTRPRGARRKAHLRLLQAKRFQFTRPRGARHWRNLTREIPAEVSIHAPARGATSGAVALLEVR